MNLDNNNHCVKYELGGRELKSILEEKYVGVLLAIDLKVSAQCSRAVKAANRAFGMIKTIYM